MSSNDQRPHNAPSPQSIPLQDLSRPPDSAAGGPLWGGRRSERGRRARAPSGGHGSVPRRVDTSARYSDGVVNGRAGDGEHNDRLAVPHIQTPRNTHQRGIQYDEGELSPVNIGEFQSASIGLSFNDSMTDDERSPTDVRHGASREGEEEYPTPFSTVTPPNGEGEEYFQQNDDRAPLNDSRYLSPISGSQLPPAPGQRHDRRSRSGSSVSFISRMLGDDLGQAEHGLSPRRSLHSPSGSRSLSISAGPINQASDMLRKMSQRVVNLSHEPEPVEPEMPRPESSRGATLDAPPSFPAMTEYAHDEPTASTASLTPPEKDQGSISIRRHKWQQQTNPLRGRSLGIFFPDNRLRLWLMELLVHPIIEPMILLLIFLQTVILAVDAAPSLFYGDTRAGWSQTALGWVLMGLFVIYTLEIVAKTIVSGLVKNADEYSTHPGLTVWQAIRLNLSFLFGSPRGMGKRMGPGQQQEFQPSVLRSFTAIQGQQDPRGSGRQAQRYRLARRAFLRHSFNRIDFIAVVAFWIAFLLSIGNYGLRRHIYVFQMLSCSRILRLLNLTSGTSVILRSLKKAAPLLVHVAFLIGFFWVLFAIVGVQSFKSSFSRTCYFLGNDSAVETFINSNTPFGIKQNLVSNAFDQNDAANGPVQFCGGSFAPGNRSALPSYGSDFSPLGNPKGFWCPAGSICLEGMNIYNNSVSFDNIGNSLELVFVIISSNTFSDLLYYTTDSDSLIGSIFFIFGIVIMSFWLMNLLVAVITSNFQVIREESRTSAFALEDKTISLDDEDVPKKKTHLKRIFDKSYWLWILVIAIDLIIMALRTSASSNDTLSLISTTETVVTLILLIEIVLRFLADWRNFHRSKRNWVDLFLAVVTTVIQIPVIHRSGQVYNALTVFQILRVYRVVYAVPLVRDLMIVVLGNVAGIANLIVFVFLVTFLAAIFAVQLLRGELPQYGSDGGFIRVTFANIFNSFLGMYQILSSENWTAIMYAATSFEESWKTSWISASFFILWFIFANFIILNMFIAVIQENFDVSEDEKRLYQVKAFLQQKELTGSTHSNLSLSAIFRFGRDKKKRQDPIDFGPATIEMFKDAVVRDFLDEQMEQMEDSRENEDNGSVFQAEGARSGLLLRAWSKVKQFIWRGEPNPFYSELPFMRSNDDLDPRAMAKEMVSAAEIRKKAQRQYLANHPRYNMSLFLFEPSSAVRRFCQTFVGPGRGSRRIEGLDPMKIRWYTFSFIIYACIVAMVLLACIATPLYQRDFINASGGFEVRNWFVWTDLAFAGIFSIEAVIKIIADGFFWTPNAYFRGSWGFIDGIVLITLWISVIASLFSLEDVARIVGAFKALRALRLLNVSDNARDTFHSVIVMGGWKLLSAAFVSLSLLIPFAIYGVNLFSGRLFACNDTTGTIDFLANPSLNQCFGEYPSSPFGWNVLAPRTVQNQYFGFDTFADSLFILFQIVSQEGWIDVMWAAIAARSVGQQPLNNNNPANGIFFVVFNLLGAVFVLTLFVSIFMRSYTEQTGVAYLTAEQRSWLELRKLLRQISPSKRPSNQPNQKWKNWCYRTAVNKHGTWQRMITIVLVFHLILLASESYPENPTWDMISNVLFVVFIAIYIANIIIRLIGLTWKRFRRSSWDLYSLFAVGGTVILTILNFAEDSNQSTVRQLQKLFLVSITLLLIPRNNQLDQLFKTAAASFSAIANLLMTWIVLFLVFAIALTQTLGLTKFGSMGRANLNFRNVPKALILLFRMSCGEGWNQIMMDFSNAESPTCITGDSFFNSDCGSAAWARGLFIAWNILSMYIFVSMFVSLIFESFSYVYQQSSGMSILSREEIRRFKQAWATFDPDGTGFIPKEAFPRLLGELSGVFAMRIYDGEHSVRQIMEDCQADPRARADTPSNMAGIDLAKLNRKLRSIDVTEIRNRRQRLNIFSQEILVSADPDRGVAFMSCLLILAHYNVITDSKSLRLEEFLRRRYRLQRVEEEVQRRIVIGFFDTLYWSRAFRRRQDSRHSARMVDIPQFAVPEILVDDQDDASPQIPRIQLETGLPSPTDSRRGSLSPEAERGTVVSPTTPDGHGPHHHGWASLNMSPIRGPDEPAPLFGRQRSHTEQPNSDGQRTFAQRAFEQQHAFGGDGPVGYSSVAQGVSAFSPSTINTSFSPSAVGMSSFGPSASAGGEASSSRFGGPGGGGFGVESPGGPTFDGFEPAAFDSDALVSPDSMHDHPVSPRTVLGPGRAASSDQVPRRPVPGRDHAERPPQRRNVSDYAAPNREPSEYVPPRRDPGGMLSPDFPPQQARHQRQQSSQGSARTMAMETFDNSAWGESIRRSFTVRRQPTRSSRGRSPDI